MRDLGQEAQQLASGRSAPNIPAPISSASSVPHGSQFKILAIHTCCGESTFEAVDSAGNFLFRFRQSSFWSSNQVLQDDYGRTIATLKQKRFSNHSRWHVYRGEKPHTKGDLLFTMARPKVFQWKTSFNICLAGKEEPDFVFSPSKRNQHFKISHRGQIVAEADLKSRIFHPDEIMVTTLGGVDRTFIASVLIIEQILAGERRTADSAGGGGGAALA